MVKDMPLIAIEAFSIRFFFSLEVTYLRGDNKKAKKILGWKPKTKFEDLVKIMLDEDDKILCALYRKGHF